MKKVIIAGMVACLICAGLWPGMAAHPEAMDERNYRMSQYITQVIEGLGIEVSGELFGLIEVIVDYLPLSLIFLGVFGLNVGWAFLIWFIINAAIRLVKKLMV